MLVTFGLPISVQFLSNPYFYAKIPAFYAQTSSFYANICLYFFDCDGGVCGRLPIGYLCTVPNDNYRAICGQVGKYNRIR